MFKEKFNKLVEERETNVSKISKETGIPMTTMYDWKHGRTGAPSIKYLKPLSEYFDVPVSYFLED